MEELSELSLEKFIEEAHAAQIKMMDIAIRPTRLYIAKELEKQALRILGFVKPPFRRGQGPRARRLALKQRRGIKVLHLL